MSVLSPEVENTGGPLEGGVVEYEPIKSDKSFGNTLQCIYLHHILRKVQIYRRILGL